MAVLRGIEAHLRDPGLGHVDGPGAPEGDSPIPFAEPGWKSTSVSGAPDDAVVLAPSSGVEVDATIQHERAVNFDFHTARNKAFKSSGSSFSTE